MCVNVCVCVLKENNLTIIEHQETIAYDDNVLNIFPPILWLIHVEN